MNPKGILIQKFNILCKTFLEHLKLYKSKQFIKRKQKKNSEIIYRYLNKDSNVQQLNETLKIIKDGKYFAKGKKKTLTLSKKQMKRATVISDKKIHKLINNRPYNGAIIIDGRCSFAVLNMDSFTAALEMQDDYMFKTGGQKLLVLNFANPVNPGGGVRRGAKAQEEDLCRRSTLLVSLESRKAKEMYDYNKQQSFVLSSDYMILSPKVEIIRDKNNALLEETVIVSVLTSPAPMVSFGTYEVSDEEIEHTIYKRIMGILQVAIKYGYKYLVLGAWGCGAFGNDADRVAQLFFKAFKEIESGQCCNMNSFFNRVIFAVLENTPEKYNFNSFNKYFEQFYQN